VGVDDAFQLVPTEGGKVEQSREGEVVLLARRRLAAGESFGSHGAQLLLGGSLADLDQLGYVHLHLVARWRHVLALDDAVLFDPVTQRRLQRC